MKLLVSVGLFLTVALCILEAIWFRRAICVMIVPLATSAGSESILQQPQCRNISKSPSALPSDDEKRIDAHSRLPSPAFNSNIDARKIAVLWHSPSPSIRRGVILPQCARTPPMSISDTSTFRDLWPVGLGYMRQPTHSNLGFFPNLLAKMNRLTLKK
uniref:Secreted protein n=1 Tax=Meloidogyne hapla TaxID=6305 RepID=A0A1I8BFX3_MELHA